MSKLLAGTLASPEYELWSSLDDDQKKVMHDISAGWGAHNLEAEQALLGAIMVNNAVLYNLSPGLEISHFYVPVHQKVFHAILRLVEKGMIADPFSLKHFFPETGSDAEVARTDEGGSYLSRMAAMSVMVINPRDYSDLIIDLALRRKIVSIMMKHILTPEDSFASEQISSLLSDLMDLPDGSSSRLISWKQASEIITKDMKSGGAIPHPTGIWCLDNALHGGFYDQMVFGFIAPSGKGKTSIALTIFGNMVNQAIGRDYKLLYVCAEMGAVNCHQRVQAKEMKINSTDFYDRKDDMDHMLKIEQYSEGDCDKPGIYADASQISFSELRRLFTTTRKRHNVKGFFLDYLSLVQPDKGCRLSRVEFLETVANWIASFCVKNDCWACIVEQANDDGTTRWGKSLNQAADFLFLMQGDRYMVNEVELSCAWLRNQKERHWPVPNIGTPKKPALILDPQGPHFRDVTDYDDVRIKGTFKTMDND